MEGFGRSIGKARGGGRAWGRTAHGLRFALQGATGALVVLPAACGDLPLGSSPGEPSVLSEAAERYTYRVVAEHPHDPEAFTQGLVLDEGVLFEGTGLLGRSSLRQVELATGEVLQRRDLPPELFGEGVTAYGDRIVQLTWQAGTGFVYDRETFAPEGEFSYDTEGWGITHDGDRLIMSDGTHRLFFLDPVSLDRTSSVSVTWQGEPVDRLNELEYIDGHVFANVWPTDRVAIIDPSGGDVVAWLDLSGLLTGDEAAEAGVTNGIAFDSAKGRLLVTGKLWPRLFEIEVVPEE